MARITRKELKTDKFALEVEHTVTFFEEHQKDLLRYAGILVAVAVLFFGYTTYRRHQETARQAALAAAIRVQEASVGAPQPGATSSTTFPTQQLKDETALKAFNDLRSKYSGSAEAEIAGYYIGSIRADQGNLAEAEKNLQEVAQKGDQKYASLAKLSLAQVYFADGKTDQGQKVLEDLRAHPTVFVSKEQATIALARALIPVKPAEARKLLDAVRNEPGAPSQVALSLYSELPPQ